MEYVTAPITRVSNMDGATSFTCSSTLYCRSRLFGTPAIKMCIRDRYTASFFRLLLHENIRSFPRSHRFGFRPLSGRISLPNLLPYIIQLSLKNSLFKRLKIILSYKRIPCNRKKNKIAAQHRENTIPAGRSYMISDLLFKNIRLFNPAVLFTLRFALLKRSEL